MRSQRYLTVSALSLLLLPLICLAQNLPNRGTISPPRRGGGPASSDAKDAGQGRSARGTTLMRVIQLPAPVTSGSVNVETALTKIQSIAVPSDQPLKLSEISQLAWAAQGRLTPADDRAMLKVHFALPDGLFLYVPSNHSLEPSRDGDLRARLVAGLLNQQNGPVGGCQIVVSGNSKDFNARYGGTAKGRNVMLLVAGQMVQNIQLQAVSLNLTCVGINSVDVAQARRICALNRDVEPLYVLLVGYPLTPAATGQTPPTSPAASAKRVLIVAPENGFQDAELIETRRGLEMNSVQVTVASTRAGPIRGMGGATARADLAITQVSLSEFNAVVFVGGINSTALANDRPLLELVRQAYAQRKVLAASGNAPAILAAAGVLKGTRATGAPEVQAALIGGGAAWTGRPVERDGALVTSVGPGPQLVPVFVQAILDALAGV